jgi:hypothetical protein
MILHDLPGRDFSLIFSQGPAGDSSTSSSNASFKIRSFFGKVKSVVALFEAFLDYYASHTSNTGLRDLS